jgi:RHS repeat-associated protein
MECPCLPYQEKDDRPFFLAVWKKSAGKENCENYYPFGLTFNEYSRENSPANQWKFQGQERQDELDLGWDSFKWRNHMPEIGRFFNVDPLADKYVYNSPYAFSENHVTSHAELEGLEKVTVITAEFVANQKGRTVNTGNHLETDRKVYNKNFNEAPNGGDFKQMIAGVEASNGEVLSKRREEGGANFFEEFFQSFTGDSNYFSEELTGEDTKQGSKLAGSIEDANYAIDIRIDEDVMTLTTQISGGDEDKGYSIKLGDGKNGFFNFTVGTLKSGRDEGSSGTTTMSLKFNVDKDGNAFFTQWSEQQEKDKNKPTRK